MKRLKPRRADSPSETVEAFALRVARGLLITASWALFLVALVAGALAEMAGRSAARIRRR